MKAPLRYAFGWVVYVAMLIAVAPVVRAFFVFLELFPVEGSISIVAALAAFIAVWWLLLRRFWSWCDQPRKATREVSPCS